MARTLLEARLRSTARRIRTQRALEAATLAAIASCGLLAIGVAEQRLGDAESTRSLAAYLASAVLLPLLAAVLGAAQPLAWLAVASRIDRTHAFADRFSSAWAFAALPEAERSPFMHATCAHAAETAAEIAPALAAPFAWPKHVHALSLAALGAACITQLPAQRTPPRLVSVVPMPAPVLAEDDAAALRSELAAASRASSHDATIDEAARELNATLDALANGKLDREAAFAKLHALEAKLEQRERQADAVDDALAELGRSLQAAPATKALGDALAKHDAQRAAHEAGELAARTRDARTHDKQLRELARALAERKKRELDRLDRERKRSETQSQARQGEGQDQARDAREEGRGQNDASRERERLDRQLDQSAQQLAQNQREAASKSLDQAADELRRLQSQSQASAQARELAQRSRELRALLQRQRGDDPGRQQGQAQSQAQAQPRAPGESPSRELTLERFRDLARQGDTPGGRTDAAANSSKSDPHGAGRAGPAPGTLPETPAVTSAQAGSDVQVSGQAGRGPTRSQIIYEAASRGFASGDYEAVHGDYARHAETELERDRVPGGYRYHVRRYFQLIRPREDVHE